MENGTVRSLHLHIEKTEGRSTLLISSVGLNVSESQSHQLASDFLELVSTDLSLSVPTITRQFSDGPLVAVEYELTESANVTHVPL